MECTLFQTPLYQEEVWPQGTGGHDTGATEAEGSRLGTQEAPRAAGRETSPRIMERASRKPKNVVSPGVEALITGHPPGPHTARTGLGPQGRLSRCHLTPPSPQTLGTRP